MQLNRHSTDQVVSCEVKTVSDLAILIFAEHADPNDFTGVLVELLEWNTSHNTSDTTGCSEWEEEER